jgi:hypothetical protein
VSPFSSGKKIAFGGVEPSTRLAKVVGGVAFFNTSEVRLAIGIERVFGSPNG